jgi:hypothetical protein
LRNVIDWTCGSQEKSVQKRRYFYRKILIKQRKSG